jgi:ABC-2 type transport system permease protein
VTLARLRENSAWMTQVFSLELRKLLSYRFDFWMQFLLPTLGQLAIAYFLWRAIYAANPGQALGGYSFHAIMLYYLLASLVNRVIEGPGWKSGISVEIYEGTLTRYLIYPVSFFAYKVMSHLASGVFSWIQLLVTVAVFLALFGVPADSHLSLVSLLTGTGALLLGSLIAFLMLSIVDMVAFWADNVWSLQVMLRFALQLSGGYLIPLALFPDWAQNSLRFLPFPCVISFPIRALMGTLSPHEILFYSLSSVVWIGILSAVLSLIWKRGLYQYSGVGI